MWNLLKTIKGFGKKSRPFFQTKWKDTLVENDEIISRDIEVPKTFQNLFSSIVENLHIQREETHLSKTNQDKPLLACIEKLSTHPSIISIQKRMETNSNKLSFQYQERKKFLTEIQNLDYRNASQQNNIPVKILTVTFALIYYIIMSITLFSNNFPKYLQRADITPVFKKDEKFLKTNYKPVSI